MTEVSFFGPCLSHFKPIEDFLGTAFSKLCHDGNKLITENACILRFHFEIMKILFYREVSKHSLDITSSESDQSVSNTLDKT